MRKRINFPLILQFSNTLAFTPPPCDKHASTSTARRGFLAVDVAELQSSAKYQHCVCGRKYYFVPQRGIHSVEHKRNSVAVQCHAPHKLTDDWVAVRWVQKDSRAVIPRHQQSVILLGVALPCSPMVMRRCAGVKVENAQLVNEPFRCIPLVRAVRGTFKG